jgi:predicted RNase H-like HicB family nuclease
MSRYLIVIEKTKTGFSAYSPDLPGSVATGKTRARVESEMRTAIEFHIEGLRRAGEAIPQPTVSGCALAKIIVTSPSQHWPTMQIRLNNAKF